MCKITKKNDKTKVNRSILGRIMPKAVRITLFRGWVALKNFLYSTWRKRQLKTKSKKMDQKKLLEALARFGPSDRTYRGNSLRLYYTPGVNFMAGECQAWNLIMTIKPIFEMLTNGKDPVAIKIQGTHKNRTKVTYYDGSPGICTPGEEYIAIPFPLKKLVLFYTGGVLMLANEYA